MKKRDLDKEIYESTRNVLNQMKVAFSQVVQRYLISLLTEMTGDKAFCVDIRKLNDFGPQLHVETRYEKCLVTCFDHTGTIGVEDIGGNPHNLKISDHDGQMSPLSDNSIMDTIFFLQELKKDIQDKRVVMKYDKDEQMFIPEYK